MPEKTNQKKALECSASHLAEMLGLSMARISQMVQEGTVYKLKNGKYDAIESVKNYVARQRVKTKEVSTAEGVPSYDESKARKEAAQAGLAELKLAEAKMEVVRIAEIDDRDAKIGNAVRAATMKRRSELPPLLEGLSASQIVNILDEHDRTMLEKLADKQSEFWDRLDKLKAALNND